MRILHLLAFLPLLVTGCGETTSSSASGDRLVVVASVHPVASMARVLLAEAGDVRTLLPPGVHADSFEPTPRMAEAMAAADLVVRVGLGLDGWVGESGAPELVLAEGNGQSQDGGGNGQSEDGRGHDHGAGNPHVWLDPIRVRDDLVPKLTAALAAAAPSHADDIRARAAAFGDSLTALDSEIRRLLDGAATRHFVAAHPAWEYFAQRYDLVQVGVLHPSPGQEIGTRELARLVTEARRLGVRAVMAEPQLGAAGVETIADELDVRVEVVDPIGGPGMDGREEYLPLMRFNARAFARALGGPQ